jgi:hypothetical protein
MKYLLAAVLLVAACGGEREESGQCPAGEVCSPATPNGLDFVGTATVDGGNLVGPLAMSIGGTQAVTLYYGGIPTEKLDLPYGALVGDGSAFEVTATIGPEVELLGLGSGESYLRIVDASDGSLFDRKQLSTDAFAAVSTFGLTGEQLSGTDAGVAFAAGDVTFGVGLAGSANGGLPPRLVDSSAVIDGIAGAQFPTWDSVQATLAVGTYPIEVTSGGVTQTTSVVVVDHADSIQPLSGLDAIPDGTTSRGCFTAISGTRDVVGLSWTFAITAGTGATATPDPLYPNCADLALTDSASSTITVTATAGGQSLSYMASTGVPLSAPDVPMRAPRRIDPAGERAAASAP